MFVLDAYRAAAWTVPTDTPSFWPIAGQEAPCARRGAVRTRARALRGQRFLALAWAFPKRGRKRSAIKLRSRPATGMEDGEHPLASCVRFSKAVRSRRHKLGVLHGEFADLCGLDRTYIGGIERGERNVSLVNIEKIAKALHVSLSELFSGV